MSRNNAAVPQAREALNKFKIEAASRGWRLMLYAVVILAFLYLPY